MRVRFGLLTLVHASRSATGPWVVSSFIDLPSCSTRSLDVKTFSPGSVPERIPGAVNSA